MKRTLKQDIDFTLGRIEHFKGLANFAFTEATRRWARGRVAFYQGQLADLKAQQAAAQAGKEKA